MYDQSPVVLLVHGAFAESVSWNGVVERLQARGSRRSRRESAPSLAGDAAYVRATSSPASRPVVLVAHSYGGMVITEAAAQNDAVRALVYVCAFAPRRGSPRSRCREVPRQHARPGARAPGQHRRQRPPDQARPLPPPVLRGRARRHRGADGRDPATGQ